MHIKTVDDRIVREVISEISGSKKLGQKREPPWFHPFPARMPISVATYLVEHLTSTDAIVLDPMVGSGTTLIAAKHLGRQGFGFDRDPLALLIAKSAITIFNSQRLEQICSRILSRAQKVILSIGLQLEELITKLNHEDNTFIKYWFPLDSQKQLFALACAINEESDGIEKDFSWVVFSSLIIAKSSGASFALDLSRSRPHKVNDKIVVLPFAAWERKFQIAVARLPFMDSESPTVAQVFRGDARELPLNDQSVDFVLTSPPYLNAIDYMRTHKFSLVWMGQTLQQIRELRGTMVGTERGLWTQDGLPVVLENRINRNHQNDRKKAQRRRYLSDIGKIFGEISRVLRPGGLVVLIAGPSIISNSRTDSVEIIAKIGDKTGLRCVANATRNINSSWRSLPPPQIHLQNNSLALRMRREVIVVLRK